MKSPDAKTTAEWSLQAERIMRRIGRRMRSALNASIDIQFKGRFDMVTEMDLAAEKQITEALASMTPDIPIMAEESEESGMSNRNLASPAPVDPGTCWILDPLDGTTNFAHGFPHFCISLALFVDSAPVMGLIYDPCKDEMFIARRGDGVTLNGAPVHISDTASLEHSLVATGFPYKVRELENNNLMEFCAFRLECQGVRRFGAAALDLAYVAAGRLDGFWERWLKPWDTAAGILMVTEAGGIVTRFDGSTYSINSPEILAGNPLIHDSMKKVLNRPFPPLPDFDQLRRG